MKKSRAKRGGKSVSIHQIVGKIVETVKKPFSKINGKPVPEKQAGGISPKDIDITSDKAAGDQLAQKQPRKRPSTKTKADGESHQPDPAQKKKRLPFGGKGRPRRPSKKEQQAIAEQKKLDELDKDIDSMSASPV